MTSGSGAPPPTTPSTKAASSSTLVGSPARTLNLRLRGLSSTTAPAPTPGPKARADSGSRTANTLTGPSCSRRDSCPSAPRSPLRGPPSPREQQQAEAGVGRAARRAVEAGQLRQGGGRRGEVLGHRAGHEARHRLLLQLPFKELALEGVPVLGHAQESRPARDAEALRHGRLRARQNRAERRPPPELQRERLQERRGRPPARAIRCGTRSSEESHALAAPRLGRPRNSRP
ncbi:unnamed protein product [Prorocentrum cordatum]|uniref:Uncharacterized protein n=1 Tax=Prorocentrum cordatum TaxID=2364126 RepID=A0ABN9SG56_9DINO|nr:unnamed protein product [Polarella glacialis]